MDSESLAFHLDQRFSTKNDCIPRHPPTPGHLERSGDILVMTLEGRVSLASCGDAGDAVEHHHARDTIPGPTCPKSRH